MLCGRSSHRIARATRICLASLAGCLACLAVLLAPRTAHAQRYYYAYSDRERSGLAMGVDLEGAIPVDVPQVNRNNLVGGGGIKFRIGEQLRYPNLRFTPELGYGYDHLFANDNFGNAYAWDLHRVFAGARLGFGRILVPTIYAHIGYGWRATGDPAVPEANGLAFDAGGALDLPVSPHVGFGAHAEYGSIESQPYTPHWVALGLHLELVF